MSLNQSNERPVSVSANSPQNEIGWGEETTEANTSKAKGKKKKGKAAAGGKKVIEEESSAPTNSKPPPSHPSARLGSQDLSVSNDTCITYAPPSVASTMIVEEPHTQPQTNEVIAELSETSVESHAAPVIEDDSTPVKELPVPTTVANTHLIDETTNESNTTANTAASSSAASSTSPIPSHRFTASGTLGPAAYSSLIPLSKCASFLAFRSSYPRQRVVVGSKTWTYFDIGPKDGSVAPLICIPGTSGTAEGFFFQLMELGNRGYRIISVSPPAYFTHDEWCNGFNGFLAALGLTGESKSSGATSGPSKKVHVFAASLAGYLCLYYISHIIPAKNFIGSLILCNSFNDTSSFQEGNGASGFCIALLKRAPSFIIKKYVLDSMPQTTAYPQSVDFMVEQMDENLETDTLASRLILNILKNRGVSSPDSWKTPDGEKYPQENITIMDTTDESLLPDRIRQKLYDSLPNARYALLKTGGDLPFLSVPDQVNMHLQVHLRQFGVRPSLTVQPQEKSPSPSASVDIASSTSSSSPINTISTSTTSTGASHPFLQPTLGSSFTKSSTSNKRVALGYGHDDEDAENDSIFLTSAKSTHEQSKSSGGGDAQLTQHSSLSLTSTRRPSDSDDAAERAAILKSIQSEINPNATSASFAFGSPAFLAARESERKEREERLAADQAKILAEQSKDARQQEVLSSLLDDQFEADEQRLTEKKPIAKKNTGDLFEQ